MTKNKIVNILNKFEQISMKVSTFLCFLKTNNNDVISYKKCKN